MQSADTPTKLLKKLHDFFSDLIYKDPNKCTTEGQYVHDFKSVEFC